MPVVVALEQQPGLAVGGPERAVLLDVGEVDERRVALDVDLHEAALQRAEAFAEGDLRLFGEMLAREDQDGVGVPRFLDGREGRVVERVEADAAHRRPESGVCRRDLERHGSLLSRRLSLSVPCFRSSHEFGVAAQSTVPIAAAMGRGRHSTLLAWIVEARWFERRIALVDAVSQKQEVRAQGRLVHEEQRWRWHATGGEAHFMELAAVQILEGQDLCLESLGKQVRIQVDNAFNASKSTGKQAHLWITCG